MEITWGQAVGFLAFVLVAGSIILACLEEAAVQDKRERERRESEALQRRGKL